MELEKLIVEKKRKIVLEKKQSLKAQRKLTNLQVNKKLEKFKSQQVEDKESLEDDLGEVDEPGLLDNLNEIINPGVLADGNEMEDPDGVLDDLDITFSEDKELKKEQKELQKIKSQQKRIEIKGIEFDWVFSSVDGPRFFKMMSETNSISLFNVKMIQNIIVFFWSFFRLRILVFLFIPFLLYFGLFLLYALYFQKRRMEENDGHTDGFGLY